jgi:hypothetical protein
MAEQSLDGECSRELEEHLEQHDINSFLKQLTGSDIYHGVHIGICSTALL